MYKKSIVFSIGATLALAAIYISIQILVPVSLDGQVEVWIPRGMTYRQAAEQLFKQGLIRDKNIFILIGRATGFDRRLKAGYYPFKGKISMWDVYKAMRDGYIIERSITIVEGDSLYEIRQKLADASIMTPDDFDNVFNDSSFMREIGVNSPSFEGYLYPDTYAIPKGFEPEETLKIMVERLRKEFTAPLLRKAQAIGFDERQALTLASIIEKEAAVDGERHLISAVYHNRLRRKMPLQADPTAVYGIKPMSEGVKSADLKRKTPYNTYVIRGLPPGPIASPGIKSIRAALAPADVPYLFFVSNGDGTHTFSATVGEHLRAVENFRRMRALEKQRKEKEEKEKQQEVSGGY